MAKTFIESIAQKLRIIPNLDRKEPNVAKKNLENFPSSDNWHHHMELDANAWQDFCLNSVPAITQ